MSYRIVTINLGPGLSYRTLQRMPGATFDQATRTLIEWRTKRMSAVVLRCAATGCRFTVEEAMEHHGLSFAERWHPQQWLARVGGCLLPAEKTTVAPTGDLFAEVAS